MEQEPPPWAEELIVALHAAHDHLRGAATERLLANGHASWVTARDRERVGKTSRAQVDEMLARARAAGWNGDEREFWKTAETMSHLSGAQPWHPQKAFMDRELSRWGAQRQG